MGYCKNCEDEKGLKKSSHPWFVILGAVILTGFIFSLPRNVINKESREMGDKEQSSGRSSATNTTSGNKNTKFEDSENAKVELALSHMNGSNPMLGIMLLKEVLSKNPDHEEASYYLGTFSMQTAQFDKAVERFKKVIELNPNHQQAKLYMGISYYKLNEKQKAKDILLELRMNSKDSSIVSAVEIYLKELNNL